MASEPTDRPDVPGNRDLSGRAPIVYLTYDVVPPAVAADRVLTPPRFMQGVVRHADIPALLFTDLDAQRRPWPGDARGSSANALTDGVPGRLQLRLRDGRVRRGGVERRPQRTSTARRSTPTGSRLWTGPPSPLPHRSSNATPGSGTPTSIAARSQTQLRKQAQLSETGSASRRPCLISTGGLSLVNGRGRQRCSPQRATHCGPCFPGPARPPSGNKSRALPREQVPPQDSGQERELLLAHVESGSWKIARRTAANCSPYVPPFGWPAPRTPGAQRCLRDTGDAVALVVPQPHEHLAFEVRLVFVSAKLRVEPGQLSGAQVQHAEQRLAGRVLPRRAVPCGLGLRVSVRRPSCRG